MNLKAMRQGLLDKLIMNRPVIFGLVTCRLYLSCSAMIFALEAGAQFVEPPSGSLLFQTGFNSVPVLTNGTVTLYGKYVAGATNSIDTQAGSVLDLNARGEPGDSGPAAVWTNSSALKSSLNGLRSFTVTFWVNGDGRTKCPWRDSTWMNLDNQRVWLDTYSDGRLRVKVNREFVGAAEQPVWFPSNGWYFVAVTYDANAVPGQPGCQVYLWSPEEDKSGSMNLRAMDMRDDFEPIRMGSLIANGPLVLAANTTNGEHGAVGRMSGMRWYGRTNDSLGALSYPQLRWVLSNSCPEGVLGYVSSESPIPGTNWLFFADSMDKILPSLTNWAARSVATNVALLMARDECESFQLVVVATSSVNNASITVSSTLHLDTETLPLTIHAVGYSQCGPAKRAYPTITSGLWPDPLFPSSSPTSIPAGQARSWWFTVETDNNTTPGIYNGSVYVSSDRGTRTIPIKVEVLPVTLPRPGNFTCQIGLYWAAVSGWYRNNSEYVGRLTPSMLVDWSRFLMRYRVTPKNLGYEYRDVWIGADHLPSWGDSMGRHLMYTNTEGISVSSTGTVPVVNAVGPWADYTLSSFRLPTFLDFLVDPDDPKSAADLVRSDPDKVVEPVSVFLSAWTNAGLPAKAYVYGIDEPREFQLPMVSNIYTAIKQQNPQTKIMQTISYGAPQDLDGLVDIWCPITPMLRQESVFFNAQQNEGRTLWAYVCSWPTFPYGNFFIDRPGVETRLLPLQVLKEGTSGLLYYCANAWTGQSKDFPDVPFSFNYSNTSGDGVLIYPGPDEAPWPSIRLEQTRDGIEDAEMVLLLRQLLEQAETEGIPEPELLEIYNLADIPDNISKNLVEGTEDTALLQDYRRNILLSIDWLQRRLARATFLSESFSYEPIGALSGKNGGVGFSNSWSGSGNVVQTNLSFYSEGGPAVPYENKLEIIGGAASRGINLSNLSLRQDAIHFISMLIKKGGTITNSSNEYLKFFLKTPDASTICGVEITSDEKFKLYDRAGSVISTEKLTLDTNYFMVMKVVTREDSTRADDVYLTWYKQGVDSIPSLESSVVWKLQKSITNSYTLAASKIEVSAGAAIKACFDDIRVGRTYADMLSP